MTAGDPSPRIVDTFARFEAFWGRAAGLELDAQIDAWRDDYLAPWPELLAKQLADYGEQGLDWRAVARERVFPFLSERLPEMRLARENLHACIQSVHTRAQAVLGLDFPVLYVIYVGIGCGAGWATELAGTPACLFGLENIAECGWSDVQTLAALAAHELSHLLHQQWRARSGLAPIGHGPWWQLYEEGFAQRCEHAVMDAETWHEAEEQDEWLTWCTDHRAELAADFVRAVDGGEPINRFFGSWFDIEGHTQCGYFLGHEIIREWERTASLREIAVLTPAEIERRARRSLEQMAQRQGSGRPNPQPGPAA